MRFCQIYLVPIFPGVLAMNCSINLSYKTHTHTHQLSAAVPESTKEFFPSSRYSIYCSIHVALNNYLVMYVCHDTLILKCFQSIAKDIPAYRLRDILDKFSVECLDPLPLLSLPYSHICDSFPTETVFAYPRVSIRKASS